MPPQPGEVIYWIKVEKPTFDLAGVLVSSLELTTLLVGVALMLGMAIGLSMILSRRRGSDRESLDLA